MRMSWTVNKWSGSSLAKGRTIMTKALIGKLYDVFKEQKSPWTIMSDGESIRDEVTEVGNILNMQNISVGHGVGIFILY